MKRSWRIACCSLLARVAVLGYAAYRIAWGKPFTINMLANRQALEFLTRNPELFTTVGLIDGSVFLPLRQARPLHGQAARRRLRFVLSNHDDGRRQALARYQRILDDMSAQLVDEWIARVRSAT